MELADHIGFGGRGEAVSAVVVASGGPDVDVSELLLAEVLTARGVPVDALFRPDDHEPPLGHEYQLDLTTEAGRQVLDRMVLHLQAHTVRPADHGRVVSTRWQLDGAGPAPLP
ncbi:hypothetical protein [Micromonospora sp. NPDC023956]|uniref:hypothetical protein n=1 Tax=Micromonospora sp. NPDC023956 TaxID=3155722 RepID=UPI0033F8B81A